jgi:outer membrane biosynthesis protein TonB
MCNRKYIQIAFKENMLDITYIMESAQNAEDAAWETMSYTDRFLWYLDNKILKTEPKPAPVEEVQEKPAEPVEPVAEPVAEPAAEPVEGPTIELPVVKAEEAPIAKAEESVKEQPSPKKRSSKGKKISIEM